MIVTKHITVDSRGHTDVIDITPECREIIESSGFDKGLLTVFNPGSTGGLTTIEYEPNLVKDLREALEIVAPSDKDYHHFLDGFIIQDK